MNPNPYQKVEIFIDGDWVPAVFYAADFVDSGDDTEDELWWMDYFLLENGDTIPEDTHQDVVLPQWRAV